MSYLVIPCSSFSEIIREFHGFSGQKITCAYMCSYGDYGAHICTSFATRRSSAGDNLVFVFAGHGICTTCTTSDRRDELDRAPLGRREALYPMSPDEKY